MNVQLDGQSAGTMDYYGAGDKTLAALTVSRPLEAGLHKLRLEVNGKSADSKGYEFRPEHLTLILGRLDAEKSRRALESKIADLKNLLQTAKGQIPGGSAPEDQSLRAQAEGLDASLGTLTAKSLVPDLTQTAVSALLSEAEKQTYPIKRLVNFADARAARPAAKLGLLTADSMSLVYPRELPCQCSAAEPGISMAKGEYENLQPVVMAYGAALKGVNARVTSIVGPDGKEALGSLMKASIAPSDR
ncbi:hypothetical protein N6H14_21940 [Paenibacillus sp. CC-CFT747]|nr:hypothetical protein N6H14_21940 [Paenibacillus sp. CC-CFT747]